MNFQNFGCFDEDRQHNAQNKQHVKGQEGTEEQKTKKDATGNRLNFDTLLLPRSGVILKANELRRLFECNLKAMEEYEH